MWQALETKAKFIAQVMRGNCGVRKADDIGEQQLSYAEVKAIASGNPAVLTLAETDAELQRIAILRKNHLDGQYLARRSVRELPDKVRLLATRIDRLTHDKATLDLDQSVVMGNQAVTTAQAVERITARLDWLPPSVSETRAVPLGTYRGLAFGLFLHPLGGLEAYLDGQVTRRAEMRDNAGARAVLNAVERLAAGYGVEIERCEQDRAVAEGQFTDFESRLGAVFPHAGYERELTALRDKLKAALSEKDPEDGEPTAADLDAAIKALRGRHAVQDVARAKPKPTVARRVRAEPMEPPVAQEPTHPAEVIPPPDPEPEPARHWHARHRTGGGRQPSLFG